MILRRHLLLNTNETKQTRQLKYYRAVSCNPNPSNKGIVCFAELKSFQLKNFKNLKIKKIHYCGGKFESVKSIISPNSDIFLVSKTKIN